MHEGRSDMHEGLGMLLGGVLQKSQQWHIQVLAEGGALVNRMRSLFCATKAGAPSLT